MTGAVTIAVRTTVVVTISAAILSGEGLYEDQRIGATKPVGPPEKTRNSEYSHKSAD